MDKYSMYGICSWCRNDYMKINPMVECKNESGETIRVCLNCYEARYKNKFGNVDDSEDVFIH